MGTSYPLHKTIHHAFLARLVELNRQLVAVDVDDVAVAKFLVKHAVADREGGDGAGGFGDELAFDGERAAAARGIAAERLAAGAERSTPLPSPPPQGGRGPTGCVAAACA